MTAQVAWPAELRIGTLVRMGDDQSSVPLEHTDVVAHVTGPIAAVAVTQRFGNPFAHPVELVYLFPIPHEAAVISFEIRVVCQYFVVRHSRTKQFQESLNGVSKAANTRLAMAD